MQGKKKQDCVQSMTQEDTGGSGCPEYLLVKRCGISLKKQGPGLIARQLTAGTAEPPWSPEQVWLSVSLSCGHWAKAIPGAVRPWVFSY